MATDSATPPRLTVEAILAAADTPKDTVLVPEWGGTVEVIGLTKRQQVDIRRGSMVDGEVDPEKVQAAIFREGVIDPIFTEDQMGSLFEKSAGAVDRVLTVILRLSGMDEEAVKQKEKTFRP